MGDFQEVQKTPSDIMKEMILSRWRSVEDFFTEDDVLRFSRSTKSLARMYLAFARKGEVDILAQLDDRERAAIEKVRSTESTTDLMEKRQNRILMDFADQRMELVAVMIARSSIIIKDFEVDFMIPKTLSECEALRTQIQGDDAHGEDGAASGIEKDV